MGESKVNALGYMEVGVSDLDAWRQYAEQVLGVQCVQDGSDLLLRIDRDAWRIRLTGTGEDDITCAGFQVASNAVLDDIMRRLEAMSVPVIETDPAVRGVDRLVCCSDPGGLRIELYVGDRSSATPFESPRGVSGFLTGSQGLGHIVLFVSDQEKAEAFYMQGLGFLLSDHIFVGPPDKRMQLTFMHCNPRHHTLAIVPVPAPKRLNHIMLQVTDMDDVGGGLDAANDAGVKVTSSLGKHTNDHMTSFYMQTPSGFDVEYGYGGREIDDAVWQVTSYEATSIWGHRRP